MTNGEQEIDRRNVGFEMKNAFIIMLPVTALL